MKEPGMFLNLFALLFLMAALVVFYALEFGVPGFFLGWQPSYQTAIALGIFSIALSTLGKR
jgi:hypothetical protein